MSNHYDRNFFQNMGDWTTQSAEVIVPFVLKTIEPNSILDLGGGTGGWAATFARNGIQDFLCVDGAYVNHSQLKIPPGNFVEADLSLPVQLGRQYELALCLEVGEHLAEEAAGNLIDSLTRHSDVVLFSAAIPKQGGTYHINEQWPNYWAEQFKARKFQCFDCVRGAFWEDPGVAWYYKQNMLLYIRRDSEVFNRIYEKIKDTETSCPRRLVHPDNYGRLMGEFEDLKLLQTAPRLPWAFRALGKALVASVRHRVRATKNK